MILTSVDLPAPFSPISALISPLRAERLTASLARTSPKRLVMPESSSRADMSAKSRPRSAHGLGLQLVGGGIRKAILEQPPHDLRRRPSGDEFGALVARSLAADRRDA